jgi:hypothetical protein
MEGVDMAGTDDDDLNVDKEERQFPEYCKANILAI